MPPLFVPADHFREVSRTEIFPDASRPLEIDLGCGDGTFLTGMATHHPERDFLGVERMLGRVSKTARKIGLQGLTNARIMRIESADYESLHFTLTMAEDLDCSGLPDKDHTVCHYDEGFLAGMLLIQTGEEFHVREIDCWCTGDRTCRFEVKPLPQADPGQKDSGQADPGQKGSH